MFNSQFHRMKTTEVAAHESASRVRIELLSDPRLPGLWSNSVRMLVTLLALTLFASAFLLFWCQPMVAKMVLPFLGGSASVWTTCVLFFQAVLLAGYVYAHVLAKTFRLTTQFVLHSAVMMTAVMFLPLHFVGDSSRAALE